MILFALFCLHFARVSNAQGANYVRYDNYSAVDFDNSTGFYVPNVSDCVAQSNVAPLVNGVAYNNGTNICKVLTATNNEIVVKLRVNVGWVTYVKNNSDQYRLIFKVASNYSYVYNDTFVGNLFLGQSPASTTTFNETVASLSATDGCFCAYRNPVIDSWAVVNTKFIKIEFIKNQQIVASLQFNAYNLNNIDWFTNTNTMIAIPYVTSTLRIGGGIVLTAYVGSTYTGRFFEIFGVRNNCADNYVILVTNNNLCSYEYPPWPRLQYSATNKQSIPTVGLLEADYFIISAQYNNRVVIMP